MDERFISAVNEIKGILPCGRSGSFFEWLGVKRVRKEIKAWGGEPLEVLKHLTDLGCIEQAACQKAKKAKAK
jgi:hypothetical protein